MVKALVVDDSRAIRMLLNKTLKNSGMRFRKLPTAERLWKLSKPETAG